MQASFYLKGSEDLWQRLAQLVLVVELNFKFYRQATNNIVGIPKEAAAFLRGSFSAADLENLSY